MKISFTKMQGAGNDFVVIDETSHELKLSSEQYRFICDRHFGVGADQVLSVHLSPSGDADFEYRIHNADGSEVEQCGNGARCFVRFVVDKALSKQRCIRVLTKAGIIMPHLLESGLVAVDMGVPRFEFGSIPFIKASQLERSMVHANLQTVCVANEAFDFFVLSMGNPHAVLIVDDVDGAPVEAIGNALQRHAAFPNRVNVGFTQIVSPNVIRLRVFERGAGETLACGTGACAAVVAGILQGLLASTVLVQARGGELEIEWGGLGQPVELRGPATTIFEGSIDLPDTLS